MKRKLLITLLALVVALSCALSFTACGGGINGTYYLLKYDETLDTSGYIKLDGGNWEDDDGAKGTYKTDGNMIRLYITLFGETEVLAEGTVENGVLKLDMGGGADEVYITETHEHKFGEWKTVRHNCLTDGLQTRECACGVKEDQTLPAVGRHTYGEWITVQQPCAKDGLEKRTCVCGEYEERTIEATGSHVYSDWVVTKEPEYSVFGQEERYCTICNEKETRKIDRLAKDFYKIVDLIDTEKNYLCTVVDAETKTAYDIDNSKSLIRCRVEGDRRGVYYEILSDRIYKIQYNNNESMYHKTFSSQQEVDDLNLIDLNALTITDFNETENYYTVTFKDKSYKMVLKNNSVILTSGEISITFDNIGNRAFTLPDERIIIDDTV